MYSHAQDLILVKEKLLSAVNVAGSALLPEIPGGFDKPLEYCDFARYKSDINTKFSNLLGVLDELLCMDVFRITNSDVAQTKDEFVATVVIVIGEHSKPSLWTTDHSLECSRTFLNKIVKLLQQYSFINAIVSNNEAILKCILKLLRPRLLPSTWKLYPASVNCYCWILYQLRSPHIGENLNMLLPTSLILTDDFVIGNKIQGLNCLEHIIKNTTRAELSWYGQDEVIFQALKPSFYLKDFELIPAQMSCVLALLSKMYPQHLHCNLEWTHYDDILDLYLDNMYMEQSVQLRHAYIKAFPGFLSAMCLSCSRFMSRILDVLEEYCLSSSTTLLALKSMEALVEVCWPRIQSFPLWPKKIMLILLKLLVDEIWDEKTLRRPQSNSSRSEIHMRVASLVGSLCRLSPPLMNDFKDTCNALNKEYPDFKKKIHLAFGNTDFINELQ